MLNAGYGNDNQPNRADNHRMCNVDDDIYDGFMLIHANAGGSDAFCGVGANNFYVGDGLHCNLTVTGSTEGTDTLSMLGSTRWDDVGS